MIDIVGGAYFEFCVDPHWSEIFGSGGRSAAALQGLSDHVTLWSYVAPGEAEDDLHALAAAFDFEVRGITIPRTLSFHYAHPLATPRIEPNPLRWQAMPIEVHATRVLRFGLLEGEGVVSADWAVYDPQQAVDPALFTANGSQARHLAIVANARQIGILVSRADGQVRSASQSSETRIEVLARRVLALEQAEVVVVKQGSKGALVVTERQLDYVPPFRTRHVWPLGSGDVFTAVFALGWLEERRTPVEAAQRASRATAVYCESKILPIPANLDAITAPPVRSTSNMTTADPPEIYLAGPFFNMAERWLELQARDALQGQGLRVFSPLRDVGLGSAGEVVAKDIAGLNRCSAVFAILDGLDSGTLFEIGYARALGLPVIAFAQKETKEEALKMLHGTDCEVFDDFSTAIYHTAWIARER